MFHLIISCYNVFLLPPLPLSFLLIWRQRPGSAVLQSASRFPKFLTPPLFPCLTLCSREEEEGRRKEGARGEKLGDAHCCTAPKSPWQILSFIILHNPLTQMFPKGPLGFLLTKRLTYSLLFTNSIFRSLTFLLTYLFIYSPTFICYTGSLSPSLIHKISNFFSYLLTYLPTYFCPTLFTSCDLIQLLFTNSLHYSHEDLEKIIEQSTVEIVLAGADRDLGMDLWSLHQTGHTTSLTQSPLSLSFLSLTSAVSLNHSVSFYIWRSNLRALSVCQQPSRVWRGPTPQTCPHGWNRIVKSDEQPGLNCCGAINTFSRRDISGVVI